MGFELEQLREAARKYPYHDAGTHGVWAKLVWERKSGPWAITSASIALLFAGFPHLVD